MLFCYSLLDTVSEDIGEAVRRYYLSKDYESEKITDIKGSLKVKIGTVRQTFEGWIDLFENCLFKK